MTRNTISIIFALLLASLPLASIAKKPIDYLTLYNHIEDRKVTNKTIDEDTVLSIMLYKNFIEATSQYGLALSVVETRPENDYSKAMELIRAHHSKTDKQISEIESYLSEKSIEKYRETGKASIYNDYEDGSIRKLKAKHKSYEKYIREKYAIKSDITYSNFKKAMNTWSDNLINNPEDTQSEEEYEDLSLQFVKDFAAGTSRTKKNKAIASKYLNSIMEYAEGRLKRKGQEIMRKYNL